MADLRYTFEALVAAAHHNRFEAVLGSSPLAGATARRHPLNFVAIRVTDGGELALRLHLWSERFTFGQAGFEVHDHMFDLDSFVMGGTVRQTIYRTEPAADGALRRYVVHYGEDVARLEPASERLDLHETQVDWFSAGARYELRAGILHRLEPITPSAVTLVLTRARHGQPVAIGPADGPPDPRTERSAIRDVHGRPMTIAVDGIAAIVNAAANLGRC